LHKWLLAPTGSGFLSIGPGNEDRLQPLQVSWGWHPEKRHPDEPDGWGTTPRLRRLEFEGTRDLCAWLAVPTAIDFQANLGWDAVRQRTRKLAALARRTIGAVPGLKIATPEHPDMHGNMTAFELRKGLAPEPIRSALWEQYRIEAPIMDRPDRFLLRASTHFYNTGEQINRLAEALGQLLGG
jgi:isopenicillin-N epimerase